MPEPYEPRYLKGIEHFNNSEFFEAHEVWEELWQDDQSPSKKFYKGLIQVAVCLHHFGNSNIRGARKLFHSSTSYLAPYQPRYLGVDVTQLMSELKRCCADMVDSTADYPDVELVPDLLPEIHLDPAPSRQE